MLLRRQFLLSPALVALAQQKAPRQISGVYPHLAMYNSQGECGTGAVVPWAGKLWVVTYSPHKPAGSDDKLYEISADLEQTIRKESIGGTPANRMIHKESQQLFIGPYVIDAKGNVRVIPYEKAFGRPTGNARHLTDPARYVYLATMEEGFYEIDVKDLSVKQLYEDANAPIARKEGNDLSGPLLPGYHGKGFYMSQGRVVYANNGEVGGGLLPPDTPSGCLAEWDGKQWNVVRRNQFTEVTGPGGIMGNPNPATDPIWAVGWDHRSLILMLLDGDKWSSYRLPKASHCYDGAHGWNTEWPRIRDIGETSLLMTMHGMFWRFPKTFRRKSSSGIAPRSSYLRVIGDFTRWGERLVMGCDDTAQSEFLNTRKVKGKIAGPGQSQSNLWFLAPARLDQFGTPIGRGALWLKDDVTAGEASDPYLFSGFDQRMLHLTHGSAEPLKVSIEVDRLGNDQWTKLREIEVPAAGYKHTTFGAAERGAWIRLKPATNANVVTAYLQYANRDTRLAAARKPQSSKPALIWATNRGTLLLASETGLYELDKTLALKPFDDPKQLAWMRENLACPQNIVLRDAASAIYLDEANKRWRLPKSAAVPGPARVAREVSTERDLLHLDGTFYELPSNNAGGIAAVRPVATHNLPVRDFCSWRGLAVLAGLEKQPVPAGEFVTSTDGKQHLWLGASDDFWRFGKVVGEGGPWLDTNVTAGAPSDPYLFTGYDQKTLTLTADRDVEVRVELDLTGFGLWVSYETFRLKARQASEHRFPAGFAAYWLRTIAGADAKISAQLRYS